MRTLHCQSAFFRSLCVILLFALSVRMGAAQGSMASSPMGTSADEMPGYLAHAGLEQRLGQSLPLGSIYTDETGRTAPLSSWMSGKPVALALIYYRCTMLCPQVLHGLADGLRDTSLEAGKDYQVLVFSIDPGDTSGDAAMQKSQFLQQAHLGPQQASAVHFLTANQGSINAIAGTTGFHYVKVPGPDGKMNQFAHSSVVMFATPEGKLSKYLSGITYPARDVRLALLGASQHKISNPVDLLILYCCSYNPAVGRYSVSVLRVLSLAGMGAVIALLGMLFLLARKPRAHAAG